jgi:site-specific DNA recombinase
VRAGLEVADIFRAAGPRYRAVHAGHLSLAKLKVMIAIGDQLAIDEDGLVRLVCAGRPVFRGGRLWSRDGDAATPQRSGSDPALVALLREAHGLLLQHKASPLDLAVHSDAEAPATQRDRRRLSLGLLAPDIQRAILERRAPAALTPHQLLASDLPVAWADQRRLLGFTV